MQSAINAEDTDIALRAATPSDALSLGVLATQVFLDTYAFAGISEIVANEAREAFSTNAFSALLTRPSTFITVAIRADALVGFAQTTLGTRQDLAPAGTPAAVGSRLLCAHEALAAEHGAAVMWLSPWVGNHRALRFYARHGYQDHGQVFFRMGPSRIENRVYAKLLHRAAA